MQKKQKRYKNPDYDVTIQNPVAKHQFQRGGVHKQKKKGNRALQKRQWKRELDS